MDARQMTEAQDTDPPDLRAIRACAVNHERKREAEVLFVQNHR